MSVFTKAKNRLLATRNGLQALIGETRVKSHRAALSEIVNRVEGLLDYADEHMSKDDVADWRAPAPINDRLRTEFERWAASRCIAVARCDDQLHGIEAYTSQELTTAWAAVRAMADLRK